MQRPFSLLRTDLSLVGNGIVIPRTRGMSPVLRGFAIVFTPLNTLSNFMHVNVLQFHLSSGSLTPTLAEPLNSVTTPKIPAKSLPPHSKIPTPQVNEISTHFTCCMALHLGGPFPTAQRSDSFRGTSTVVHTSRVHFFLRFDIEGGTIEKCADILYHGSPAVHNWDRQDCACYFTHYIFLFWGF